MMIVVVMMMKPILTDKQQRDRPNLPEGHK